MQRHTALQCIRTFIIAFTMIAPLVAADMPKIPTDAQKQLINKNLLKSTTLRTFRAKAMRWNETIDLWGECSAAEVSCLSALGACPDEGAYYYSAMQFSAVKECVAKKLKGKQCPTPSNAPLICQTYGDKALPTSYVACPEKLPGLSWFAYCNVPQAEIGSFCMNKKTTTIHVDDPGDTSAVAQFCMNSVPVALEMTLGDIVKKEAGGLCCFLPGDGGQQCAYGLYQSYGSTIDFGCFALEGTEYEVCTVGGMSKGTNGKDSCDLAVTLNTK